jgi:hypothetical protein
VWEIAARVCQILPVGGACRFVPTQQGFFGIGVTFPKFPQPLFTENSHQLTHQSSQPEKILCLVAVVLSIKTPCAINPIPQ